MKTTGMIFTGDHPQLIQDGLKTMTRRVIVPQPKGERQAIMVASNGTFLYEDWDGSSGIQKKAKYQVGDRLRVRESILINGYLDLYYMAGNAPVLNDQPNSWKYRDEEWKGIIPSIHMPNWATRSMLEILEIRAERVQEITEADATAEGCNWGGWTEDGSWRTAVFNFEWLWDSLNAKRGFGWDFNPWCWCISFKLIERT